MTDLPVDPRWLAQVRERAQRPPLRPRLALRWREARIGSVDPETAERLHQALGRGANPLLRLNSGGDPVLEITGEALTPSLARLADAMRDLDLSHAWRDEQLAVTDEQGRVLGSVERAVVRPLGVATHAVHLVGRAPGGDHWVQQRALDKANDPGLWDTLMGGMVPASDTLQSALERETWEEAGLHLQQLQGLALAGRVTLRRPTGDGPGWGYVVEAIDWYRCVLPANIEPINQDGEVACFERIGEATLLERLHADAFTTEAALILAAAGR